MRDPLIDGVEEDIRTVKSIYLNLLSTLPSFEIASAANLPYGLKPHTRSVSWIVEQVINQQTAVHKDRLGLSEVNYDLPDTSLHDCELVVGGKKYYVNIKIHNVDGKPCRNDISAVEKLYSRYRREPGYNLIYVCLGIRFDNHAIRFDPEYLEVFSPQFLPIYVNPRNDKIQALYKHSPIRRSRTEFLDLLVQNSKTIALE